MANRTINDEIIDIVSNELNKIAFPSECCITRIYANNYADIESSVYGTITYAKVYGKCDLNENGILLFLDNDLSKPIVITNTNE